MHIVRRVGGTLVITVRLTLLPGRDDDLIGAIQSAPRGVAASVIREMMRSGLPNRRTNEDALESEPDMAGLGIDL
jgi:hypothetical protein